MSFGSFCLNVGVSLCSLRHRFPKLHAPRNWQLAWNQSIVRCICFSFNSNPSLHHSGNWSSVPVFLSVYRRTWCQMSNPLSTAISCMNHYQEMFPIQYYTRKVNKKNTNWFLFSKFCQNWQNKPRGNMRPNPEFQGNLSPFSWLSKLLPHCYANF